MNEANPLKIKELPTHIVCPVCGNCVGTDEKEIVNGWINGNAVNSIKKLHKDATILVETLNGFKSKDMLIGEIYDEVDLLKIKIEKIINAHLPG